MEDPTDRIFECQNEACRERSCRYCRVKSHHPMSCDGTLVMNLKVTVEYQKDKTVDAKHAVEEAMTAALVNVCNACKRTFLKDDGCNKMTCPCGNSQCDVCGQNADYDHFKPDRCPLFDNAAERERREVAAAQLQAVRTVRRKQKDVTPEELIVDKDLMGNIDNNIWVDDDYDDLHGPQKLPEEQVSGTLKPGWREDIERERARVNQIAMELNEKHEREEREREARERRARELMERRAHEERERQERERRERLEQEEEEERQRQEQLEREWQREAWEEEQMREQERLVRAERKQQERELKQELRESKKQERQRQEQLKSERWQREQERDEERRELKEMKRAEIEMQKQLERKMREEEKQERQRQEQLAKGRFAPAEWELKQELRETKKQEKQRQKQLKREQRQQEQEREKERFELEEMKRAEIEKQKRLKQKIREGEKEERRRQEQLDAKGWQKFEEQTRTAVERLRAPIEQSDGKERATKEVRKIIERLLFEKKRFGFKIIEMMLKILGRRRISSGKNQIVLEINI